MCSRAAWSLADQTLAARNAGAVVESVIVELCKSSFEQVGWSVDRKQLNFEGKVLMAAIGMLPYVGASVFVNGWLASLAQPPHDSHEFVVLVGPVLMSTIVNGIRGAANAATVRHLHRSAIGVRDPSSTVVRSPQGVASPQARPVLLKTAVRFFLISCRNAIYLNLRAGRFSVLQANCIAQLVYAVFAQNRDLMFDLMQGEGWSSPYAQDDVAKHLDASSENEAVELDSLPEMVATVV